MQNQPKLAYAKIKEGFVLLSSGLFTEAIDTLQSISLAQLPDSVKREYYSVIARTYYDLADYNRDPQFTSQHTTKGNAYLDSALLYVNENTNEYWAIESLRRMKKKDWKGAKYAFTYWMNNFDLPRHFDAIATSSLGYIYSLTGYEDKAIEYLILAAIADIKNATKETVALRNLANALFQRGDKKRAYRYIIMALEDATYYNARHRKIEIATILPIIEGERLAVVEAQKTKLIYYIVASTFLSVLVLAFLIIIYRQLKKITKIRKILQNTVNEQKELNSNLSEANQIKEEYIGYFFNVNSEYIEKMDDFQKHVFRKISARQFDDLHTLLKNTNLKKERQLLFHRFDEIFLKLFPNFIAEFNKLFPDEHQVVLKKGELLNSELRIFALIRLGITDNEKIAKFLNFSVTTIYTYKTKTKSKSYFREAFDEKIMDIKAF
ncbi:hypothetical protein J1N10_11180 [Carboxylicivirga sp. A043]|uniref:DUF6377 domain-containing protein n=1 Tax=Carboxylicivirga litoralis TaxID=2816963 RepID=UPI0021CB0B41|nr:DUF6377 domain-containing protein [Carboxylicivirga sp. A043]MCU4156539.1 hypothetical protein [Carboxylicivirga sp. A043]